MLGVRIFGFLKTTTNMRFFVFGISFFNIWVFPLLHAQTQSLETSTSTIFPDMYRADAIQLATRHAARQDESEEVSLELADSMEKVLWAIAAAGLPQSKLILDTYPIHTSSTVSSHRFYFWVDSATTWAKKLAFTHNTANTPLATLQFAYQQEQLRLSLDSYNRGIYKFELVSGVPMNMDYFAKKVSQLEYVSLVEVPSQEIKSTDIQLRRIANAWVVYYYLNSWEQYPHNKHQYCWQFGVSDSGEVQFITEFGDFPPVGYTVPERQTANAK
jgi:hypothetical protein